MTEFSDSKHPVLAELFYNRDLFSSHLTKIHFTIGQDPLYIPRIRVWLVTCRRATDNCRSLGHQILSNGGDFLIGQSSANHDSVEWLFHERQRTLSEAEKILHAGELPSCRLVPRGGLYAHENLTLRRHTIERHVAKSYDYLAARLKEDKTLPAASSFTDRATAESAISKVLTRFADYIVKKSAQGKKQIDLPNEYGGIDIGIPIGVVLTRSGELRTTTRVRVSLRISEENNQEFFIKTAYPTL